MLKGKSILITGGTGSFGKKFTETILKNYPEVRRLVIYSRDEQKQFEMAQDFPKEKYPQIRYFIGDVRDGKRFKRACEDIDVIIHAGAMKQVPVAEYNPMEAVKTNVMGAENIISAALDTNVRAVIALSTDKAAAPINLYGATKLVSDKLFIAANNIKGKRDLRFSVVRYGNVMGSRGSVIPFLMNKAKDGILPITHKDMTRFNITLDESVSMVIWAMENSMGGELFVPKIPSYKLLTLAKAIAPSSKVQYTGIRPGEKLHEEMITASDSHNTIDIGKYYVILPSYDDQDTYMNFYSGAQKVPAGFSYNSNDNNQWISIEEMRELIRKHIDPNFKPL
jgi:UDP-N-acetylglucosamine 4,6-dehydratase (inverting)